MADVIQQNFERFHAENPHIYDLFDSFAREMIRRLGAASAGMIFERIRWELSVVTHSDQPVKLNNNYRSRYVRLFEEKNPKAKEIGFFRTRRLSSDTIDSTSKVPPEEYYGAWR